MTGVDASGTRWPSSSSTPSSASTSTAGHLGPDHPAHASQPHLVRRPGPDLGQLHRGPGQDPGHRLHLRCPPGQARPAHRPDRLALPGQVVAPGRPHLRTGRPGPGHALHHLLLPAARPGGAGRPGRDRGAAVGHHRHHGSGLQHHHQPGRGHRRHRVHRDHRRLVHRLFRAIEGRDPLGPDHPDQRRPGLRQCLPHRTGRRRRLPAGRGQSSTSSPSATSRASPSSSGSPPCSTSSSPTSSPGPSSSSSAVSRRGVEVPGHERGQRARRDRGTPT